MNFLPGPGSGRDQQFSDLCCFLKTNSMQGKTLKGLLKLYEFMLFGFPQQKMCKLF
jgi:hypothetical protein